MLISINKDKIHKRNFMKKITICLILSMLAVLTNAAFAQRTRVTGTSYAVPAGFKVTKIECWGGGGGGAYAYYNCNYAAGTALSLTIGSGGAGSSGTNNGGDTYVSVGGTIVVRAGGGYARITPYNFTYGEGCISYPTAVTVTVSHPEVELVSMPQAACHGTALQV